jgi:N-acetylmuramoyl-L-alanine amidase
VYKVDGELRKGRKDSSKGVWVLDAPEINYPSVLIECGNLNNSQDLDFIKSQENQEKIARQILNAVYQYAEGQ